MGETGCATAPRTEESSLIQAYMTTFTASVDDSTSRPRQSLVGWLIGTRWPEPCGSRGVCVLQAYICIHVDASDKADLEVGDGNGPDIDVHLNQGLTKACIGHRERRALNSSNARLRS